MKRRPILSAALVLLSVFALGTIGRAIADRPVSSGTTEGPVTVLFSPDGGCQDAIVTEVNSAKSTLDVLAYTATSAPIAKSIADAHARGVKVRVVLDESQWTSRYSVATFLQNQSVPTFIDEKHAIMHNKVMIIDSSTVITGSFNFTAAAEESNAENLVIIRGLPAIIDAYNSNFMEHLSHSVPYTGPRKAGEQAAGNQPPPAQTPKPSPSPSDQPRASDSEDQERVVYVGKTGERFHRASCRTLRNAGSPVSIAEARRRGLTACGVCKP